MHSRRFMMGHRDSPKDWHELILGFGPGEATGPLEELAALPGSSGAWLERTSQELLLHVCFPDCCSVPLERTVRSWFRHAGLDVRSMKVAEIPQPVAPNALVNGFPPLPVGRRFYIVPPDASPEVPTGRIRLVLNPGAGFGTGRHPSTRLCLRMLEQRPDPRKAVLDLGCGSGVLSIAAAQLGAISCLAVDRDPLAVQNCLENVRRNGVQDVVTVRNQELGDLEGREADWIVANLQARIFRSRISHLTRLARRRIILGGILEEEEEDILELFENRGWKSLQRITEEGWVAHLLNPSGSATYGSG